MTCSILPGQSQSAIHNLDSNVAVSYVNGDTTSQVVYDSIRSSQTDFNYDDQTSSDPPVPPPVGYPNLFNDFLSFIGAIGSSDSRGSGTNDSERWNDNERRNGNERQSENSSTPMLL